MRKQNSIIWILLAATVVLMIWRPVANSSVQAWLTGRSESGADPNALKLENEDLKTKLAILGHLKDTLPTAPLGAKRALVYSTYPFNLKDKWSLALGAAGGVVVGSAATLSEDVSGANAKSSGILVGRVVSVFAELCVIQTIFDPSWKSAVKVGPKAVDALLLGGAEPRLTLMAKTAVITPGMSVYSAAADLPYGLTLGEVGEVGVSADQLFLEANLSLSYNPNNVDAVFILPNPSPFKDKLSN